MIFITPDGHLSTGNGLPYIKAGKVYRLLSFPDSPPDQLSAPAEMDAVDIYRTKASISWTKSTLATAYVLERATNLAFTTGLTSLYTGANNFYDDTSIVEDTVYYYRVKATGGGISDSNYTIISFKTFFSPSAFSTASNVNPPGRTGNRFANSTDVSFFGGNVNLNDFIIVGSNSGGNGGDWGVGCFVDSNAFGAMASSTNKVVVIGGRAYDWMFIDMSLWLGIAGTPRIVTNSGGQVNVNNFDLYNPQYVKLSGIYDATAKTGDTNFRGLFSTSWKRLSRSFGFHFKGRYADTTHFGLHISGKCSNTIVEGIEGGEGNYVAMSVKNDGFAIRKASAPGTDQNHVIPNTGSGIYTTISITDIAQATEFDQVRLFSLSGDVRVNWLEFELQSAPFTVTRIQAESFVGNIRTSTEACTDSGGGLQLNGLVNFGNSADYSTLLPGGTYTVRLRATSVGGGTVQVRIGSVVFDTFEFRHNYMHDTWAGENIYTGSTQPDPQQEFKNLKMHHNLFVRAGLNGIQTGQLVGSGNEIYNNVIMSCCMSWTNAFARFQDQSTQQSSRTCGFKFYNNIVTGGADSFINYFMLQKEPLVSSQPTEFYNNVFMNSIGFQGAYINTKDPYGGTVRVNNNLWGRMGTLARYGLIYPWQVGATLNHVVTFESSGDPVFNETSGVSTLECDNNIYDFTVSAGTFAAKQGDMANLTIIDGGHNLRQATIPDIQFSNFMDLPNTYNWESIESWTDLICPNWDLVFNAPSTQAEKSTCSNVLIVPTVHPTSRNMNLVMATTRPDYAIGQTIRVKSGGVYFYGVITSWTRNSSTTGDLIISSISNVGTVASPPWTIENARNYNIGQIVFYNNRYYMSKVNNNAGNVPSTQGDSNWQLLVFSNGSLRPVDDLRLLSTDFYHLRGIGTGFTV